MLGILVPWRKSMSKILVPTIIFIIVIVSVFEMGQSLSLKPKEDDKSIYNKDASGKNIKFNNEEFGHD